MFPKLQVFTGGAGTNLCRRIQQRRSDFNWQQEAEPPQQWSEDNIEYRTRDQILQYQCTYTATLDIRNMRLNPHTDI